MTHRTMTRRALIAGCGDLGTRLGLLLTAQGYEVFGLRRDPSALPAPIQPLAADLGDPATLTALPDALETVVLTAAAGRSDEAVYRRTYVDAARNLAQALSGQQARRLLFVSSTSVYAQDDGSWVDEDSPAETTDYRGSTMLEAEQILNAGPIPTTSLRLGGIYGPGRTYLIDAVRHGRLGLSPDGNSAHGNRIHVDDAASALAWLADLPDPAPLYLGVDSQPARRDDVVRFLADQLGVTPGITAGSPLRGGDKRCRNARLLATGFALRYPSYREGYAALLADPD